MPTAADTSQLPRKQRLTKDYTLDTVFPGFQLTHLLTYCTVCTLSRGMYLYMLMKTDYFKTLHESCPKLFPFSSLLDFTGFDPETLRPQFSGAAIELPLLSFKDMHI